MGSPVRSSPHCSAPLYSALRRARHVDPPMNATPPPLPPPLDPAAFVRRYWHKRPLLMRAALPDFGGLFSTRELFALAARDDVESRLVVRTRDGRRDRWTLEHGPFRPRALNRLPARDWTLLVQGLNLHDDRADALMRRFDFLPFTRLDDVMVSLAAPGGGVGPHLDSYDVFLLQGTGRRHWRYGAQRDHAFKPGLPLKILARFAPRHAATLGPGDMLYLPPSIAHDGVAVDPCTTYSIGFRAAAATELAEAWLDAVRDSVDLQGRYRDPDLTATRTPAALDAASVARFAALLRGFRRTPRDFARFLGTWLSEPKPAVVFAPPAPALAAAAFARVAARHGVALDRRTQMLYDGHAAYVNGMVTPLRGHAATALRELANRRALPAARVAALPAPTLALLHDWYRDGYLHAAHSLL
ncbi:MAG: cupin domain-containing protein [Proteobacteria bacterium]|nr:cupin domain-containing protein [Pseudomonadota bacterium]